MLRFFITAHYVTSGGRHGSTCFPVIASSHQTAETIARGRVAQRGRSKIRIHID